MTSRSSDQPNRADESALDRIQKVTEALAGLGAFQSRFEGALDLALDEFLSTAQWPEREQFRRRLAQRGLGDLNLDEMWQEMPRPRWEQATLVPDRIVLSLQTLHEMPKAKPLLDACMAIVRRAYDLYISDIAEPRLRSDDPALLSAAGDDAQLLLCAREVLDQHRPDPMGGGSGGIGSIDWYRLLNDAAMPAFKGVVTVADYLGAQAKIIAGDRKVYGRAPMPPRISQVGGVMAQPSAATPLHVGETPGSTSAAESPTGEANKNAPGSEPDRKLNQLSVVAAAVAAVAAIVGALSDLTHLGPLTFVAAIIAGVLAVCYWRDSRRLAAGLTVFCLVGILLSVRTIAKPETTSFFYNGDAITYASGLPYAAPLTANPSTGSQYDEIETPTNQTYTFVISCTAVGRYDGKPLVWAHIVSGDEPNLWIPISFLSILGDKGKTSGLLSCTNWRWLLQLWSR